MRVLPTRFTHLSVLALEVVGYHLGLALFRSIDPFASFRIALAGCL